MTKYVDIILIGTHADQEDARKVHYLEAEEFASQNKIRYFEIDNQNSEGAHEAINYLVKKMLETKSNN